MTLAMIMAMDRNRLIGKDNGLPWHLPADLKYFKQVTMGKPIIMGRKTFESIGRPLPGRVNIVVTRSPEWHQDGCETANSLKHAIKLARQSTENTDEIMIIGGASLCQEAMPYVQTLYLTIIDHAFEGDTWLDSFHEEEWVEETRREFPPNETDSPYPHAFVVLNRKVPAAPL
ncbi:MAG TPA: dihydrofolate reductase [Gammaproteobacteria bacterium]|jgi:Dihydrofolate reductase|nr:dihydrofolate reductase [Gammaproteobacteria bacterium]